MNTVKPVIYQLMPRWFTNCCEHCVPNGSLSQNGAGKFNDINDTALRAIAKMGATHVWYTGIIRHATTTDYTAHGIPGCHPGIVKGKAGSPYAITDYYDVDPDLAVNVDKRMQEFHRLVERTHANGLKVIIDFVPNHVARQYRSTAKPHAIKDLGADDNNGMFFDPGNDFYYITGQPFTPQGVDIGGYHECPAKATGNDCFHASPGVNDWYDTVKLNYGVDPWNGSRHFHPIPGTWHKMLQILLFWAGHQVDGFRCDMAHMVPVEFWHWAIAQVKKVRPDIIFIAEIYDPAIYRSYIHQGGFDYLYDKVTLYDTLRGILTQGWPTCTLTGCWQQVHDIREHMLSFLENHDEQRLASPQFCGDPFKALPALVTTCTFSQGPFMLYAGQELGERGADAEGASGNDGRTTIFDYWSVSTLRRWNHHGEFSYTQLSARERELRKYYQRLLRLCNQNDCLRQGGFFDLMYANQDLLDAHRHYAYLRHHNGKTVLVTVNFGDHAAEVGVRIPGHALECACLTPGQYQAEELLTGATTFFTLDEDRIFCHRLPPNGATLWHLSPCRH